MAKMYQYGVSVPAPDLSGVLARADRIGTNSGYNEFLSKMLDEQARQEDIRLRAEQTRLNEIAREQRKALADKAKNDLADKGAADAVKKADGSSDSSGDHPGGHGWYGKLNDAAGAFNHKMGEIALNGLERVGDIAARVSYGGSNAANYLASQDEEHGTHKNAEHANFMSKFAHGDFGLFKAMTSVNPFDVVDDLNTGDIGGTAHAFWKGIEGKDKMHYAKVIQQQASTDNQKDIFDSKIYQGVMGFVGDVGLDPTTYIGGGLVTKPLKAGSRALRGAEAAQGTLKGLADDIGKMGIRKPDGLPKDFIGPRPQEKTVTAAEAYAMLGGGPVGRKGRAAGAVISRKAQQAHKAQILTESVPRLKKWIRDDPGINTVKGLDDLDNMIAKHAADYKKNLDDYAGEAFDTALKTFDENPHMWPVKPAGESLLQQSEKSIPIMRTADSFKAMALAKNDEKVFHEAMGKGWQNDQRISPEFKAGLLKTVHEQAKSNSVHNFYYKKAVNIKNQIIKPLEVSFKRAVKENNPEDIAHYKGKLKEARQALNHAYRRQHVIKASILHDMTNRHILSGDGLTPELKSELSDLLARESELNGALKHMGGAESRSVPGAGAALDDHEPKVMIDHSISDMTSRDHVDTSNEFNSLPEPAKPEAKGTFNDVAATNQELKDVQKRILQIQSHGDFIPKTVVDKPATLADDFKVTEDWLSTAKTDPEIAQFHDVVEREVIDRSAKLYDSKVEAFLRTANENRAEDVLSNESLISSRVRGMFGHSAPIKKTTYTVEHVKGALADPAIMHNGKRIFKNDKKAIEDAGLIKREDQIAADSKGIKSWEDNPADQAAHYHVEDAHQAFDRIFKEQHGVSVRSAIKIRDTALKDAEKALRDGKSDLAKRIAIPHKRLQDAARHDAIADVNKEMESKAGLKSHQGKNIDVNDVHNPDLEERYKTTVDQARMEYAMAEAAAKANTNATAQQISTKISELRKLRDTKEALHKEAFEEAKRTRAAMADTLDEQITLNALEESIAGGKNYIRLNVAGVPMKFADIPVPRVLTATTQAISGLPILQAANNVWSKSFSPASKLEPELNLARLRAQSRTPDIIHHHVQEIRQNFSKYKPHERSAALAAVGKGVPVGDPELYAKTEKFMGELTPYFDGKVKVGGETITPGDINRYLPDEYKIMHPHKGNLNDLDLSTPAKLVESMRNLKSSHDPMKLMWHTRIAIEQAMSHKAMQTTITGLYGVKRIIRKGAEKLDDPTEQEKMIESLREKHDWVTVKELGDNHYFSPETATEVQKLLKMMEPGKVHEATRLYDKVTRVWKSTVTVYNPGYYTRNAIGETMMGMFDGLTNPRWYSKAGQVLKYSMPDTVEQSLRSLEPWKKHATTRTLGNKAIMTLTGGKKLTAEDVWVLYHESGLKSGFVSSEFDHYFPSAGKLQASAVGQVATKINDGVRSVGEKHEDFFRLSHFMYRMGKSGHRDPVKAAQDAATFVRKYHFDYTDFTPFEKTTMLRVFPFYKWTRKALPMMAGMLFTDPGKVMLYPKAMQNLSYATGGTDVASDNNGYFPNYEKLTPQWMQNLMAYPIGKDDRGAETLSHMATPQFDVYSMMKNPTSTMIGMLNPLVKMPFEQATGHTMDPEFNIDFNHPKGKNTEHQLRRDHVMRATPQTSLLMNALKGRGEGDNIAVEDAQGAPNIGGKRMDEKLLSFMSGLGFYENNDKTRKGEQLRQNIEKGKNK